MKFLIIFMFQNIGGEVHYFSRTFIPCSNESHQFLFCFVLTAICSERVGQMTKTFNDIEAVTRLLEEKERDLELAARIGQTLLDRNKSLSEKNDQLEAEVSECHDKVCVL